MGYTISSKCVERAARVLLHAEHSFSCGDVITNPVMQRSQNYYAAYTYTRMGTRALAMATLPGLSPTCIHAQQSPSCILVAHTCKVSFHAICALMHAKIILMRAVICTLAGVPKKSALWRTERCYGSARMMRFSVDLPLPYTYMYIAIECSTLQGLHCMVLNEVLRELNTPFSI